MINLNDAMMPPGGCFPPIHPSAVLARSLSVGAAAFEQTADAVLPCFDTSSIDLHTAITQSQLGLRQLDMSLSTAREMGLSNVVTLLTKTQDEARLAAKMLTVKMPFIPIDNAKLADTFRNAARDMRTATTWLPVLKPLAG